MDRNVCGRDRAARLVGGTLLVVWALLRARSGRAGTVSVGQLLVSYAGAELLVTGLTQWCPGNALLGIDTCR